MVLLRNFVKDEECEKIANMAMEWGESGEDGFYTSTPSGKKVLNTGESRGRIYDFIARFPPSMLQR